MDLLEHPTPTAAAPAPGSFVASLPASQAILALSFGCSFLVLLIGALASMLAG